MSDIRFNGERVLGRTLEEVESCSPPNGAQHLARYRWAAERIRCGQILDCACGAGYGTNILAKTPGSCSVIGADIDPDSLAYANKYWTADNIKFITVDMLRIDLGNIFDSIVSLESIEHVARPDIVLERFTSMMLPGANLIVSVPIIKSMHINKFHLWEVGCQADAEKFFIDQGLKIIDRLNQDGTYLTLELMRLG